MYGKLLEPCAVKAARTVLWGESLKKPIHPNTCKTACTKGSNPFASKVVVALGFGKFQGGFLTAIKSGC